MLRDSFLLPIFAIVLLADQLTKSLVESHLARGESVPREGLVRITHVTNTGSAFGLFPDQTLFLIIASFVGVGVLLLFYRTHTLPGPLMGLSLGLQLGGAMGNLVDRVRLGYVVDFIDLGWWPVFNVADSSIVIGIILLGGMILFSQSQPPRRRPDNPSLPDPPHPPPPEVGC
ncbi:MAG: signal peptidase II [Chloroflexi bacterium]|nr:signal peptidase II [Chloroflexota bacterium]